MGDQPRIAVVGSTMIDLIADTACVLHAGETIQGDDFQLRFGGKGASTSPWRRPVPSAACCHASPCSRRWGGRGMQMLQGKSGSERPGPGRQDPSSKTG